jgi:hypothetical protein
VWKRVLEWVIIFMRSLSHTKAHLSSSSKFKWVLKDSVEVVKRSMTDASGVLGANPSRSNLPIPGRPGKRVGLSAVSDRYGESLPRARQVVPNDRVG